MCPKRADKTIRFVQEFLPTQLEELYKILDLNAQRGGPHKFCTLQRCRVLSLLTKRRNEVDEMTYHELTDELSSIKKARKEHDNIFVPAEQLDRKVDSRTTAAFIKRNNLQLGNKQNIDKSRVAACLCPLMSYVWYVICLAISGFLAPCCKWNADACTFVFHSKHEHKTVRLLHENEYEFLVDGEVQLNDTEWEI